MTTPPPGGIPQVVTDPLSVVAVETERHVAASGWDQPTRLFALVDTAQLLEREPHLASGLTAADHAPGALTAIEQEGMPVTTDLFSLLGQIAWPDEVTGCAVAGSRARPAEQPRCRVGGFGGAPRSTRHQTGGRRRSQRRKGVFAAPTRPRSR